MPKSGILKIKTERKVNALMKKIFLIVCAVVASALVIVAVCSSAGRNNADSADTVSGQNISTYKGTDKKALYILKTYNDKIGIFYEDETEPFSVLSGVMLKSLSEYDRKLLNTGIKVYSDEELRRLIEDYDS